MQLHQMQSLSSAMKKLRIIFFPNNIVFELDEIFVTEKYYFCYNQYC